MDLEYGRLNKRDLDQRDMEFEGEVVRITYMLKLTVYGVEKIGFLSSFDRVAVLDQREIG